MYAFFTYLFYIILILLLIIPEHYFTVIDFIS